MMVHELLMYQKLLLPFQSKHSEREEKFKSLTKRIGQKVEAFQKEQKGQLLQHNFHDNYTTTVVVLTGTFSPESNSEKQVKLAKASSMKPKRSDNSVSLSSHHPSFQAGSIPKGIMRSTFFFCSYRPLLVAVFQLIQ